MSLYDFKKTEIYRDKWYLFKDAVLSDIEVDDCLSTLQGRCENTKSLDDCIQKCDDTDTCEMGYFIESPTGRNFCGHLTYYTIPYFRLNDPSIYPEMSGMKPYFFTKKDVLPFPPKLPNAVFYKDYFALKIKGKDLFISEGKNEEAQIGSDVYVDVSFIPSRTIKPRIQQYIPVRHGDEVAINIPYTALVLTRRDNNGQGFKWEIGASDINTPSSTVRVYSTDKDRKVGDVLGYSESVYFIDDNHPVIYDEEKNILTLYRESLDNAIRDNIPYIFELIPKIDVYYCENGSCKRTQLENCKTEGYNAFFNDVEVHRSEDCWGFCSPPKQQQQLFNNTKSQKWYWIVPAIILFIIILLRFRGYF